MKKVINGKLYNTDIAIEVGQCNSTVKPDDINYCMEILYRKKTGEYFLYGKGGPNSKYAQPGGMNTWKSGELIVPLDYKSASSWAAEHLDPAEYQNIFGEIRDTKKKTVVTFSLTTSTLEKLKRMACQKECSSSILVEQMIENASKNLKM